jgi:hypothetical protein
MVAPVPSSGQIWPQGIPALRYLYEEPEEPAPEFWDSWAEQNYSWWAESYPDWWGS